MNTPENYEVARLAVMDPRGRFLVVQRAASCRTGGGLWEFPGGKVDLDEKRMNTGDPQRYLAQAALRECGEETGIFPDEVTSRFFTYNDRNFIDDAGAVRRYTASVALAVVRHRAAIPLLSPEIAQASWMELGTIVQQLDEGGIFRPDMEPLVRELVPVLASAA